MDRSVGLNTQGFTYEKGAHGALILSEDFLSLNLIDPYG